MKRFEIILPMCLALALISAAGCSDNAKQMTLDLGKGVTMKLVLIPAGEFMMGSPKSDPDGHDDEGPQRKVTISKPFYMGIYEVTQAQWRGVMGTEPWKGKHWTKPGDHNAASHLSWNDASRFCLMLSKKSGRTVDLPTEAQWEYACRAGGKTVEHLGNNASKLGDYAWYDRNAYDIGGKYAHAVGQKLPNAFGLHDMRGNVWEWCRDWYAKAFYAEANTVDPENTTASKARILRGGSWCSAEEYCRPAYRYRFNPSCRNYYPYGCRVVVAQQPTRRRINSQSAAGGLAVECSPPSLSPLSEPLCRNPNREPLTSRALLPSLRRGRGSLPCRKALLGAGGGLF